MSPKNAATAALLMFVAASIVALTVKSLRQAPHPAEAGDGPSAVTTQGAAASRANRIVAYYFHGNVRCPTCESIESYAKEAVESGFPEQLKDGRLEWRIVNYEQPSNEHYAADFKLAAPCVVLVRMKASQQVEWRSLPEVWEFVGDKPAFVQFVQKNVGEFLDYIAIPGGCCL